MKPIEPINPHQFIPGLVALDSYFHAVEFDRGDKKAPLSSGEMLTDAIQYNLKSCAWSIQQFGAFIRRSSTDQPPAQGQLKTMAWHQSFDAHLAIDHFLTCARRVQDLIAGYISKALRRSLPSSMNSLAQRITLKPGELDVQLEPVLAEYWNANGARLRDYRVLSEHRGQIATDCRFYCDASGVLSFFCGLPNNPATDKPTDLSWEPAVDAYPYLRGELVALFSLVRGVVRELLAKVSAGGLRQAGAVYSFRAPFYADQVGSSVPTENDIEELLKRIDS